MLQPIYLPENISAEESEANTATFTIQPYHPGYGPTVGNALRRVLLSSLPGAAITEMKIDTANHEFSTLPGVKEDLVTIMLNLKAVKISSTSEDPVEIRMTVSGKKAATAGDFDTPPEVTVANPEHHVATLTDANAKLEIICTVEQGRGYVPSETHNAKERPIGTVALDAVFTPVERVSFSVENVRVGQATDYHSLKLTITTDGTVTPQDALRQAASILRDHFEELTGDLEGTLTDHRPQAEEEPSVEPEPEMPENTLNLLQLPSRVHNALERIGITTVEQVMDLTEEQIQDIPGLGAKAIEDVKKARDEYLQRTTAEKEVE
ncbi:MAG: DNA-directed RNA polymerase subunit alpha [Candidatus Andersenbacteria bacterium]